MDVGLDRNRKSRGFRLPPWLEERMGWIIIIVASVGIGVPLGFVGSNPGLPVSQTATINVVYGPAKSWKAGSPTHLEAVTIKIKNTGPAAASGVIAAANVHNQSFALAGPDVIEPGKVETYTGGADLNVISSDTVGIFIACANCPLTPSGATPEDDVTSKLGREHAVMTSG
jgi:hypothetical protein